MNRSILRECIDFFSVFVSGDSISSTSSRHDEGLLQALVIVYGINHRGLLFCYSHSFSLKSPNNSILRLPYFGSKQERNVRWTKKFQPTIYLDERLPVCRMRKLESWIFEIGMIDRRSAFPHKDWSESGTRSRA